MSGRNKEKPDRSAEGWRDYRKTESVDERDGIDDLKETEEEVHGHGDAGGDGTPDPAVGSSDFVSRDVKTELEKERLKKR